VLGIELKVTVLVPVGVNVAIRVSLLYLEESSEYKPLKSAVGAVKSEYDMSCGNTIKINDIGTNKFETKIMYPITTAHLKRIFDESNFQFCGFRKHDYNHVTELII
jgi:hypothetical protein